MHSSPQICSSFFFQIVFYLQDFVELHKKMANSLSEVLIMHLTTKQMYEGDNLQMLECKIPFSGSKNCIDCLNMVIEMIVASFAMCEK